LDNIIKTGEPKKFLIGKNAIITGASRGLGEAIAYKFWQEGANLLLIARSGELLLKIKKNLESINLHAQKVDYIDIDLASVNAVDAIMNKAKKLWERVDILINNAAIQGPIGPIWENDWEEWQRTIRVNLLVPVELSRYCLNWMKNYNKGKIINISGGGATGPRPNFSAYAVSKTALVRFTEILASESIDYNIQVNAISPGQMKSDLTRIIFDAGPVKAGRKEFNEAEKVLKEGGVPLNKAVDLALFLSSDLSNQITGKLISAIWDPWEFFHDHTGDLINSDIYTLRRIIPKDRGKNWG